MTSLVHRRHCHWPTYEVDMPSSLSWGTVLRYLLLFCLFVLLGAARVYMVFLAREFDLERAALQKRAEILFRRHQQLVFEKRVLAEQPLLRERARRELGLVEIEATRREVAVVPAPLLDKYKATALAARPAPVAVGQDSAVKTWQEIFDQLAAVTKVQAAAIGEAEARASAGGELQQGSFQEGGH